MKKRFSLLMLLALSTTIIFWGSAFAGIRIALSAYSPTHLAVLRFLVASSFLAGYALITHMRLPAKQDIPIFILTGLIGITVYNVSLNAGEQSITAGAASFLVNTAPIWTALLAKCFLNEEVRVWGWIGIAISFIGASIIAMSENDSIQPDKGAVLVIIAALAQSIYFVMQKPLLTRYQPIEVTAYAVWSGTICLLPFTYGLNEAIYSAPFSVTLAVIYLGIAPAALAYVTWAYVLMNLPIGRAASFLYIVPVVAIVIAWLWLHETPSMLSIIGGILAIIGVIFVNSYGKVSK